MSPVGFEPATFRTSIASCALDHSAPILTDENYVLNSYTIFAHESNQRVAIYVS